MSQDTETLPSTEGQEEGQQQVSEETMDTAFSDSTESAPESQEQKTSDFDWSTYQNADHLKGRSVQDVINYYNQRDHQWGQQANELGRLREIEKQFNQIRQQMTGQKDEKKAPKMSDVETAMFANKFGEQPYEAFREYFVPKLVDEMKGPLLEQLRNELSPYVQGQLQNVTIQQERDAFLTNHSEELAKDPSVSQMMQRLMYPDYLGDNASYEEVFSLAKMSKDEPDLFGNTCALMQRGVPYKQARQFALGLKNSSENVENKKNQIKDEFKKLNTVSKGTGKKRSATDEKIETMDDAFDVED